MSTVYKETLTEYDKCLKKYIDETMWDNLDLISYGVSWKPNVADPHLTRVGNMTYHKTLPIQNNMRGCIALMKDNFRIVYYLNSLDWRWHTEEDKSLNTLKSLSLIVTDGVYTLVNEVFKDLRFEKQWIKINGTACEVTSIDTTTKTATLLPDSELEAGTYNVELGAVLNGYDGEVMVEVPEFWIRSWDTDTRREVRVATIKIDDTWEHLPRILVSAYHITVLNTVPSNMGYLSTLEENSAVSVCNTHDYCRGGSNRSANDQYLATDPFRTDLGKARTIISRATMREYTRKSGKEILSYLQYKRVLYWLYVIEYANFNSQEAFNLTLTSKGYRQGGLGGGIVNCHDIYTYYSTVLPIAPNGYTNEFGNGTNIKELSIVISKTGDRDSTYSLILQVPRWHGIENPFGNVGNIVDGVLTYYNEVYATDDPTLYSDTNYKDMEKISSVCTSTSPIKEYNLGTTAEIVPRLLGSSWLQYKCDHLYYFPTTDLNGLILGGLPHDGLMAGIGYFAVYNTISSRSFLFGFRASYIIK